MKTIKIDVPCCPVLNPHISGEPKFPGDDTVKASVTQSPIDPPVNLKKGEHNFFYE